MSTINAFHVIELASFVVAFASIGLAFWRYGIDVVALALGAMIYSYAAEVAFVHGHAYEYSRAFFWILPGGVPAWVPVGWGTMVFAASFVANQTGLVWWTRPFGAALLALLLDIALDPLAVALGFWRWTPGDSFYGVTWNNFTGWLIIVSSYSLVVEIMYRRWLKKPRPVQRVALLEFLIPFGAMLPAFALCIVVHLILEYVPKKLGFDSATLRGATFAACLAVVVVMVAYCLPRTSRHLKPEAAALIVPASYMALFIAMAFVTDVRHALPELRVWIPFLACVVAIAYLWPSIDVLPKWGLDAATRDARATYHAHVERHAAAEPGRRWTRPRGSGKAG